MRWLVYLLVLCLLVGSVSCTNTKIEKLDIWKKIKSSKQQEDENFYEFVNRVTHGQIFNISKEAHKILEEEGHHWPDVPSDVPHFNCLTDQKPKIKARNVHELTPYDVDIVAAFGDSLTAAFGAKAYTPIDLFIEFHGVSWSIGGDGTVRNHIITLPNILKEYNPKLKGYATGISPPLLPIPNEHLDVAVSGATAYGLQEQAERFIAKMLLNPKYDFFGSWKVLTLFIGGNDLCSCCRWWKNYKEKYKPENFINKTRDVLDYLHQRVPKLFVNLVTPPNVTIIQDLASPWCDFTHFLECKCGSVYGPKARKFTSEVLQKYRDGFQKLVDSKRYDTRDDFTVVLQPFFDETIIPRKDDGTIDRSYFAPDCFHFSGKAHRASALALWNSMLEPIGNKSKVWRPVDVYHCPTKKNPYFFTAINSKKANQVDADTDETEKPKVKEQVLSKDLDRSEEVVYNGSDLDQQQKNSSTVRYTTHIDPLMLAIFFLVVIVTSYLISVKKRGKENVRVKLQQTPPPTYNDSFIDSNMNEVKAAL